MQMKYSILEYRLTDFNESAYSLKRYNIIFVLWFNHEYHFHTLKKSYFINNKKYESYFV